ncbi:uncharacterized protein LOC135153863 [Lytechinus pictus]|uniref:uncharacterized protein LOC135153863 n=1 Tax=Lytechinus pictus TaxID=7653 RepID=UPI0030B9D5E6
MDADMQMETYALDVQVRQIQEERTRRKGVHCMKGLEGVKEGRPSSWYLFSGPVVTKQRRHSEGSRPSDQVQRVSQYDKVLHNLLEDSSKSRTGHPRDHESLLDPEQTVREIVKEREEEMCQAENESKLLQIQERFTHDELNLFGAKEMTKQQVSSFIIFFFFKFCSFLKTNLLRLYFSFDIFFIFEINHLLF